MTLISYKYDADMGGMMSTYPSFNYHSIWRNAPYFIIGIAAFHAHSLVTRNILRDKNPWGGRALVISSTLITIWWASAPQLIYMTTQGLRSVWDVMWGIPFALLCVGIAIHPTRAISNFATEYLGKISFSLYLTHPFVLWFLKLGGVFQFVFACTGDHHFAAYFLCLIISVSITALVASITYRFIEKPGMDLGKTQAKKQSPISTATALG